MKNSKSYLSFEQARTIVEFDRQFRQDGERRTRRYNYILHESLEKDCDVIVLHVAVRLDMNNVPIVKDVNAFWTRTGKSQWRSIDYCGIAGWCVLWGQSAVRGKAKPGVKFIISDGAEWHESRAGGWKYGKAMLFQYYPTVNPSALKGTRFEYCQYPDEDTGKTGLIDWLMLYRQEPKVEFLAKKGLYALITPMGLKALKDRKVFDWVRDHLDEVRDCSGPRDIVYAAKHGVSLTKARKHFKFVESFAPHLSAVRRAVYTRQLENSGADGGIGMIRSAKSSNSWLNLDYTRVEKLIGRWHIEPAEYTRYLQYAVRAGRDWRNEGTLYPPTKGGRKAFMERLEMLEAEAARLEREAARERQRKERKKMAKLLAERVVEIEAFEKSLEKSKTFDGCGYKIVVAKSQKELREEGKKMRNCVGCGTYGEGIIKGDLLIVMLKDADGKSYCDIEIARSNWSVRQCYLKSNTVAPESVRTLAKEIAKYLKAQAKAFKKRRGAA